MVPLREQGATYEGQANVGRPQARSCRCHSARGMEQRLQPKIGGLKRQAAMASGSAGRSKSSREQAPAYYTSVRGKPAGRETVTGLQWDQGSSLALAALCTSPTHLHLLALPWCFVPVTEMPVSQHPLVKAPGPNAIL